MDIAMDITDITMINDDNLHKMGYNPSTMVIMGI